MPYGVPLIRVVVLLSCAVGCAQGQDLDSSGDPPGAFAGGGTASMMPAPTPTPMPQGGCAAGMKLCGGVCVAPSPQFGCTLTDCLGCPEAPPGLVAVCVQGVCATDAPPDPTGPPPDPTGPPPDPTMEPPVDPPPADPGYEQCLSLTTEDACTQCVCTSCQTQSLDCGATGNSAADQACTAIVECGRQNHCTSIGCYCGAADLTACVDAPLGACVSEIQAAAGSSVFDDVANALAAVGSSVYLADQVGQCALGACAVECGL